MPRKKGACAICGAIGPLTWDHVPPQSVVPPAAIEIRTFAEAMNFDRGDFVAGKPAFASPSFPTLCAECNNVRLGQQYDPALASLANDFATWVQAAFQHNLSLPRHAKLRIRPALVAKAVMGHLLAFEEKKLIQAGKLRPGRMNEAMRDYVLSSASVLPADLRVLVWPYPSARIVVARTIGRRDLAQRAVMLMSVLKFFPLGFAVLMVDEDTPIPRLSSLGADQLASVSDEVELSIQIRGGPHPNWPEHAEEGSFIVVQGDSVIVADPRRPRPN